jgi:hypothetical protein
LIYNNNSYNESFVLNNLLSYYLNHVFLLLKWLTNITNIFCCVMANKRVSEELLSICLQPLQFVIKPCLRFPKKKTLIYNNNSYNESFVRNDLLSYYLNDCKAQWIFFIVSWQTKGKVTETFITKEDFRCNCCSTPHIIFYVFLPPKIARRLMTQSLGDACMSPSPYNWIH